MTDSALTIPDAAPEGPTGISRRLFALKHDDTFIVADSHGDITGEGDGMFRDDTRVLSRYRLLVGGHPPALLGSSLSQDNVVFSANFTNDPLPPLGGQSTPRGVVHIERLRFLWNQTLYERISLMNYGPGAAHIPLCLRFGADFRDMFEVRGSQRPARGVTRNAEVGVSNVVLRYVGLDQVERTTAICFSQRPAKLTADRAEFRLDLPDRGGLEIFVEIGPALNAPDERRFRDAAARARFAMRGTRRRGASLRSSGRLFNDWLEKSRADLALLTTELPSGPYPYAGIPWFSTAFGRDAIVTSMQTLWLNPELARGVLRFLSQHQATETSAFQVSAPGKIMHEIRRGEMTALKEVPFGRYYGGVDTTPLFVMLAGAFADRTGDMAFIDELWPSLMAAMSWIEGPGDSNGDGFVDYARVGGSGLTNQAWKDSGDSIFHADGSWPESPVAVVEVQGYAFAAFAAMAGLAERRGDETQAAHWRSRADQMRANVERVFWRDEIGTYAIALDGAGRTCDVSASNAGHLLWTGLPAPERAARVTEQLMSMRFNSGWGVRTLAQGEARYNPMSYHNGSIWPHDTAICAAGIARYGERGAIVRLMSQLFEAASHFGMRLPELFCGFQREAGGPPIAYPVACLPQAWASGSTFMMLQACLGVRIDAWRHEIHIERPVLPVGIDHLVVQNLRVGDAFVDLVFQRIGSRVVAFGQGRHLNGLKILIEV